MKRKGICDENCNECPMIRENNSRMLTLVLNELRDEFGERVTYIVNKLCPNFTICHECRIDDFCHNQDCSIVCKPNK